VTRPVRRRATAIHVYHLHDLGQAGLCRQDLPRKRRHSFLEYVTWRMRGHGSLGGSHGEGDIERRGVVWHIGVPVIENLSTRERHVKLLRTPAVPSHSALPTVSWAVGAEALGGACKERTSSGRSLLGWVEEIVIWRFG